MIIQHNIAAMAAYRNYNRNTSGLSKNLEKLSSGYKINRAGDDAAGLAISEKMRAQITGLEVAQKNAKDGISLVQTAEGALTEVHDMLNRMYALAEQSANGTYDDEVDRNQLNKEVDQLKDEINRIADSTNFNGIKLLDGSLSANTAPAKITVKGNCVALDSDGLLGTYECTIDGLMLFPDDADNMVNGDTLSYTVSLNDGRSYTMNFTLSLEDGKAFFVNDKDGKKYNAGEFDGGFDYDTAYNALASALQDAIDKSELSYYYKAEVDGGAYAIYFEAKGLGDSVPTISAFDMKYTVQGQLPTDQSGFVGGIYYTGFDEGVEISLDSIKLWDGTNYDKAMFEINGHKFVVMANQTDFSNDIFMNANNELPGDVTILIANSTSAKGLLASDANYKQNVAKIEEVTGLVVGEAFDETTYPYDPTNKFATGLSSNGIGGTGNPKGIRLTRGKGNVDGGLTLQIGDTAEPFNQLTVDIGDCHTKAMGIGGINISTQDGASAAMGKIKDAINYVSDVRGTLGATQNRLDHTINNLSVMQQNIQDAESTIRDVDVAEEMMSYVKNNILVQSAQSMLAQANQMPQGVLQLLQ